LFWFFGFLGGFFSLPLTLSHPGPCPVFVLFLFLILPFSPRLDQSPADYRFVLPFNIVSYYHSFQHVYRAYTLTLLQARTGEMPPAGPKGDVLARLRSKEEQMFLKWNVVMNPSELLRGIVANRENARALFHGLRRQVRAIRRRSLAYRDGQVTIFDLVLIRLFDAGHTMQDYGLFEFYLAEFLGTRDCVSNADANRVVAAHLAAQRILDDGMPNLLLHPHRHKF
jgi:hypothetical protein